jgi:retron-type reverse transcriptase
MERVEEKIADSRVLNLLRAMLQAGVMDSLKGWQATEQGSPQGAVISPLLSNIYLNGLDWEMAGKGFEMVRYADDCVPRAQKGRKDPTVRNCATDEGRPLGAGLQEQVPNRLRRL